MIAPLIKHPVFGSVVTSRLRPTHKIGLSGRKHYYLLNIFDFEGKIHFYLRNPCGSFDFRGKLKDLSSDLENHIVKVTGEYPISGNFVLS